MKNKIILALVGALTIIILAVTGNPVSYNNAGNRTVVTQATGTQFVKYGAGFFWSGFYSHETEWPNQISVSYQKDEPDMDLEDNTIEIGKVTVRFSDGTTAEAFGITQYILPTDEKEMLAMHNAHKTPEALVKRRLGPYTIECLGAAAQLMTSEMHYSGGKAQMAQDYLDQLKNGVFLLKTSEVMVNDTIEHTKKRVYETVLKLDKDGNPTRKFSSIKEYGLTVADAQITKTIYEAKVNTMLAKKIDATTKASVSKQELMTAEQKTLTAKAQGEQRLVEIEYQQRQEQTKQVVAAQTQVEVAKQDLIKQDIANQAAQKEAAKIKTLADAEAYARQRVMTADGALDKKLATYEKVQAMWADAFKNYAGDLVPSIINGATGGGYGSNAGIQFMETMAAKAQMDLMFQMKQSK